jgi:hypothetical protein
MTNPQTAGGWDKQSAKNAKDARTTKKERR